MVAVAYIRLTVGSQRFPLLNLVQKVMTLQGDQSHKNPVSSLSFVLSSERSNPEHGYLTQLPRKLHGDRSLCYLKIQITS